MVNRKFLLFAAAVLLVGILAACGRTTDVDDSSASAGVAPWGDGVQSLQTKSLATLESSEEPLLVALTFPKALTLEEAKLAGEGTLLKARVIYFSTESGSGSFAEPEAVSFDDAFSTAYSFFESIAAQQADAIKEQAVKLLSGEASELSLQGVSLQSLSDSEQGIKTLQSSPKLAEVARNLVISKREREAVVSASQDQAAIVTGVQIEGGVEDIKLYADPVQAVGYTEETWELFNAIRPKVSNDLTQQRAAYSAWEGKDFSASELYEKTLSALDYYDIDLGGVQ